MDKTVYRYYMLNVIKDAYQYHSICHLERCNKNYKQAYRKEYNEELLQYHRNKMTEYNELLQFLLKDENNLIIKKEN